MTISIFVKLKWVQNCKIVLFAPILSNLTLLNIIHPLLKKCTNCAQHNLISYYYLICHVHKRAVSFFYKKDYFLFKIELVKTSNLFTLKFGKFGIIFTISFGVNAEDTFCDAWISKTSNSILNKDIFNCD